jgi:hypothetical protein
MKLPKPFLVPNEYNVKGGVEYAFMSTTLDQNVALRYAKSSVGEPSTLMVLQMGMVDRGAQLDWLSQYPEEKEILFPPLTGLEVQLDEVTTDDVRRLTMRLNINLKSLTVEELLSIRKKELGEVLEMVGKDVLSRVHDGDMPRRLVGVTVLQQDVSAEADESFNSNEKFVETMQSVMALLPRFGDEIEVLHPHDETVFALAAATSVGTDTSNKAIRLLTGSLDGTSAVWGGTHNRRWQHRSPVLAVAMLEPMGWFAASLLRLKRENGMRLCLCASERANRNTRRKLQH